MKSNNDIIQYFGNLANRIPLKFLTDKEAKRFDDYQHQLQEALNTLELYQKIGPVAACQNAMDRIIPVKPQEKPDKYTGDLIKHYYCPRCGCYFGAKGRHDVALFKRDPFCQGTSGKPCGQAIDWSELQNS